jgi:flagellar protein FlaF
MSNKNPYGQAADAYTSSVSIDDPRTLEGRVLMKSASKLEELQRRLESGEEVHPNDVGDVLDHNQKLWTVLVGDMADPTHNIPQNIKDNIASLGMFIFKRTRDVLIDTKPDKLKVLIDINRNIASGLLKKQGTTATTAEQPPRTTIDNSF